MTLNRDAISRRRPSRYRSAGRPSSPFAPKSARVSRVLLLDPARWWRQKDLVSATGLDDGNVSRIVRRLDEELLLEHRDREFRPRDADLLLDAWAQDYRFERHDILPGHLSGSGIEVARRRQPANSVLIICNTMPAPDKPRHRSGYRREETEQVQASQSIVA